MSTDLSWEQLDATRPVSHSPDESAGNTFRVRMMRAGPAREAMSGRGADGTQHKMESFRQGTGVTPKEYIDRFQRWARICNIAIDDYVTQLVWATEDVNVGRDLDAIVRLPDEVSREHYKRVVKKFIQVFAVSSAELRQFRVLFLRAHRGVEENINDYLQRFALMFNQAYPEQSLHNQQAFDVLIASLDDDFRRHCAGWVFIPEGTDADTISEMREEHHGNFNAIKSWSHLCGVIKAYYATRNPRDVADSIDIAMARHRADTHIAQSHGLPLSQVQPAYTGKYAQSLAERAAYVGDGSELFSAPRPSAATMKLYDMHQRQEHRTAPPHNRDTSNARSKETRTDRRSRAVIPDDGAEKPARSQSRNGDRAKKPFAPSTSDKKKFSGMDRKPPSSTIGGHTTGLGICPDCCLNHEWEHCSRNRNGDRFNEQAERYRGEPHFKANEADKAKILEAYGKIGVKKGDPEPKIKSEFKVNAIRMGPNGQRDIILKGVLSDLREVTFFVDTGSQVSIISHRYYSLHRKALGPLGPMPTYNLLVADGKQAQVMGTLRLPTTFRDHNHQLDFTHEIEYIVMDGLNEPALAGLNLLSKFFGHLSLMDGRLTFRVDLTPDVTHRSPLVADSQSPIRITSNVRIPARSTKRVAVSYDDRMSTHDGPVMCEPIPMYTTDGDRYDVEFPSHIQDSRGGTTRGVYHILVLNPSDRDMTFRKDHVIGRATALPLNIEDRDQHVRMIRQTINHCDLNRIIPMYEDHREHNETLAQYARYGGPLVVTGVEGEDMMLHTLTDEEAARLPPDAWREDEDESSTTAAYRMALYDDHEVALNLVRSSRQPMTRAILKEALAEHARTRDAALTPKQRKEQKSPLM